MRFYISGPYSCGGEATLRERRANVEKARQIFRKLLEMGHNPICTYIQTAEMDDVPGMSWSRFLANSIEWLLKCDAVFMVEGWTLSDGAIDEHAAAMAMHMPIYQDILDVPTPEE